MSGYVQFNSLPLVDRNGKAFDLQQLRPSDVIAFYFSAHWCPPCRNFTPMLKKFVETLQSNGDSSLKIIFVSSDKTEHEMWKYVYDSHGDWLVLPHACSDAKQKLERQFQVSGIPQLVVIDPGGSQAVRDARGEVISAVGSPGSSSTQVLTTYLNWRSAAQAKAPGSSPSAVGGGASHDTIPSGTRVRVRGLVGAPENNDKEGVVRGFDRTKLRHVIEVGEKSLSLKSVNLLQLIPVRFRSVDADAGPDEWIDAEIHNFDESAGEFVLSTRPADSAVEGASEKEGCGNDGSSKASGGYDTVDGPHADATSFHRLEFGNRLILKASARVLVHSLQAEAARQWNDKVGEVIDYDEAAERYVVQMSREAQLKVRAANVRLCPLGNL